MLTQSFQLLKMRRKKNSYLNKNWRMKSFKTEMDNLQYVQPSGNDGCTLTQT